MMDDSGLAALYFVRARESFEGAQSELHFRRFNNCVNRCYYAAFQAATAALLVNGQPVHNARGKLSHSRIQAEFARHLIHHAARYPREFGRVLPDLLSWRQAADYEIDTVVELEAHRVYRLTRSFFDTIFETEGADS